MEKAKPAFIDEITDSLKYIAINFPNDIYIGNISHIKSYDNYFYLSTISIKQRLSL